jgi:hypothetical protein
LTARKPKAPVPEAPAPPKGKVQARRRAAGDPLGIRGLLEGEDGLGDMFLEALLSAKTGDMSDAEAFADKLVSLFNATPRDELGGVSPDEAFAKARPRRGRPAPEESLRPPKRESRSRPPASLRGHA